MAREPRRDRRSNRRGRHVVALSASLFGVVASCTFGLPVSPAGASPIAVLTAYISDPAGDGVIPVQVPSDTRFNAQPEVKTGFDTDPYGVAASPDGSTVYTTLTTSPPSNNPGDTVDVIDTASGEITGSINVGSVEPSGLAVSPDGKTLAAGDYDANSINVIDLAASPPTVRTYSLSGATHGPNAPSVAFSPDGSTLYALDNSTLVPIQPSSGTFSQPIPLGTSQGPGTCGNANIENGLAVSPDGSTVAVACQNATVDLVEVSTGVVTSVQLNASAIGSASQVAFTPDGGTLVASWNDDINGGQVALMAMTASPPTIVDNFVLPNESEPDGVAITPDGTTALVAGSATGQVFFVHLGTSPSLDSTTLLTGGAPSLIAFAAPPPVLPVVSSLVPSAGSTAGGTSVDIFGSGFSGATAVRFGSSAASSYTVISSTEIAAVTPSEPIGTVDVSVATPAGTSPASSPDQYTFAAPPTPEPYNPVRPARICDTRPNQTKAGCPSASTLGPGSTITVHAGGLGGVPSSGVTAVVVNVTVAGTTASSYLTVYPDGSARPSSSNLNWSAEETVPNLVTVGLSSAESFDVYNFAGHADVIVDVEGYYGSPPGQGSGLYNPLAPARICDTRPGNPSGLSTTVLDQCEGKAPAPGQALTIQVAGLAGVPTGAAAAVLNLTAIDPSTAGYLTVYPAGQAAPLASNVNYSAGEVVANRVTVPLSSSGQVSILSFSGSPDVLVDVSGWYSAPGPASAGDTFTPAFAPTRICDTRSAVDYITSCTGQTLGPHGSIAVTVAGVDGVPSNATAVVLNVTVTDTTASSYLSLYPSGTTQPTISDLNWAAGKTVPNLAVVEAGSGGQVVVFNDSGSADVVIDVVGWYS